MEFMLFLHKILKYVLGQKFWHLEFRTVVGTIKTRCLQARRTTVEAGNHCNCNCN